MFLHIYTLPSPLALKKCMYIHTYGTWYAVALSLSPTQFQIVALHESELYGNFVTHF